MKRIILTTTLLITAAVSAQQQSTISWFTIDGGGNTVASIGGGFAVAGTIGQPDAGSPANPMIGGTFQIVGGFWPITQICNCPGDMNGDGKRDGRDIQQFVNCILVGGDCACADVDQANGVTVTDVSPFVSDILNSSACP